ncbi:hypothetical protein DFJ58DRAFT_723378 [Suillus subalutaceus]|uniref:uncharacterized protein n=1 Tax=Suillus subalutaceus TaxID=48586 RepID=UPI001B87C00E|nr:uncharacterized protein DFJ58DRAFT_723378 [Suillus subalutaceus]KAG1868967.1 hypothetical protein DFJ58DRAFT_723378 [Suillus subalutaceus]
MSLVTKRPSAANTTSLQPAKKLKKHHPGHKVSSVTDTQKLKALDDPLNGLMLSLQVDTDILKPNEVATESLLPALSTLLTPQDNISEQLEYSLPAPSQAVLQDTLQPTHIPEHDFKCPVDVSATVLAAVTVRSTEEAPGTAESTSVMHPNKASKTARNLCALDWCAEMKQKKLKLLTKKFEAYWNKLKECPDQLKIWNEKSAALMSGKGYSISHDFLHSALKEFSLGLNHGLNRTFGPVPLWFSPQSRCQPELDHIQFLVLALGEQFDFGLDGSPTILNPELAIKKS